MTPPSHRHRAPGRRDHETRPRALATPPPTAHAPSHAASNARPRSDTATWPQRGPHNEQSRFCAFSPPAGRCGSGTGALSGRNAHTGTRTALTVALASTCKRPPPARRTHAPPQPRSRSQAAQRARPKHQSLEAAPAAHTPRPPQGGVRSRNAATAAPRAPPPHRPRAHSATHARALRSTCGARWRGRTRRTRPWRSTSAGRWTGRPGWSRRSRRSTCAPAGPPP